MFREPVLREEKAERGGLHYLNNTEKMSKLIKFHDCSGVRDLGKELYSISLEEILSHTGLGRRG